MSGNPPLADPPLITFGREVLLLLRLGPVADGSELMEHARTRDMEIGRRRSSDKVLASLRDLGLIERTTLTGQSGISLTPLGRHLADVAVRDELLFAELVHLRYWWLWAPMYDGPAFAWSYQTVTDMLWESAPCRIEPDRLVAAVLANAERRFDVRDVSFSTSSLLGIQHWLRALSPPCVVEGCFQRRASCPPEALLISLQAIHRLRGGRLGTVLRLDADARHLACRSLLLDEAGLDEVLHQAEESGTLARVAGDSGDLAVINWAAIPILVRTEEL